MLFVHSDHVNFYFNGQYLQNVAFSFEKCLNIQPNKKNSFIAKSGIALTWGNFYLPLDCICKKPELSIYTTKDFWRKMIKVKITFVYLLCTIMLKKFFRADHEAQGWKMLT